MNRKQWLAPAFVLSMSMLLLGATTQPAPENMFGGPVYDGAPALAATAALIKAGGGAENFSFSKALVNMLGEKTVNSEVEKLTKQYGKENVDNFIHGMDFAVQSAAKDMAAAGTKLPEAPADLTGKKLAETLVDAGTTPDNVWWSGYLFDKALSHEIHIETMGQIDAKYGHAYDGNAHKILNQAMFDVAQALGKTNVKLAPFH